MRERPDLKRDIRRPAPERRFRKTKRLCLSPARSKEPASAGLTHARVTRREIELSVAASRSVRRPPVDPVEDGTRSRLFCRPPAPQNTQVHRVLATGIVGTQSIQIPTLSLIVGSWAY